MITIYACLPQFEVPILCLPTTIYYNIYIVIHLSIMNTNIKIHCDHSINYFLLLQEYFYHY